MEGPTETRARDDMVALQSRRKFLKRALVAAAYLTPVVMSYPSTVFAHTLCGSMHTAHTSTNFTCTGSTYSPGCSQLN